MVEELLSPRFVVESFSPAEILRSVHHTVATQPPVCGGIVFTPYIDKNEGLCHATQQELLQKKDSYGITGRNTCANGGGQRCGWPRTLAFHLRYGAQCAWVSECTFLSQQGT